MQALYYSIPFRENVVTYPPHSPADTPNGHDPIIQPPIRQLPQNGAAVQPAKAKGITAAEAIKRRQAINAGQPIPGQPQRPEDKPDSPEYKKKHAMLAGPILDLTYENATSYGMEESTFTALKDMFMALIASNSRTGVLSPQRFLEIFKRDNEMFRTAMHQDAHEFYGLVLNAVISNVEANAQRMKELEATHQESLSITNAVSKAVSTAAHSLGLTNGTGARSPGVGWVHEIFEGVLTSETKCLTCETASQRDETFLDLSIDLEQHTSITACLGKFSAEEMLCERNKFHCDNCGGLQEAEKRMKIKKLPKILALHLKRFKYTEDMTRLQKLFHRVVYPYYLRMFNTTDEAEDPDRLYELYAIVVHIGGNAYHGHYVSIIKTPDRGWLLFDDEMVEPVDKHYVKNFFGDKPGQATAYVLFYQETTVEAMRKEQEAEGLAEVQLASREADVALGIPQPAGTHPASVSKPVQINPIDETPEFVALNHANTAPSPGLVNRTTVPASQVVSATPEPPRAKTKADIEREKKEAKEAEKARKAADKIAEKERAKQIERRRKEAENQRRNQADDMKKILALSKQTADEEEAKRRKEGSSAASESSSKDGGDKLGSLGRKHTVTKSMSRKSFGFLGKSDSKGDDTALEGHDGPQTPEKHQKSTKERFSFSGLGRKKSNLNS